MSKYRVTTDQGTYEVTTEDQKTSFGKKAMGYAELPSKVLGATLDVAKEQIPTRFGKGAMNVLSKTIPPTFTPLGLGLMAGTEAVGPAAKAVSPFFKGLGSQLESLSGMKTGLLSKAYEDPSLIFAGIPEKAREAYRSTQPFLRQSKMIMETPNPMALVNKALKGYDSGTLFPEEAMEARKAVDQLWNTKRVTKAWADVARNKLDTVAKLSGNIEKADIAFARGAKGSALRQVLPQNKYGGTSAFKTGIMAALATLDKLGGVPGGIGKLAMTTMSPLAQGLGATGLGMGVRTAQNPGLVAAINSLIQNLQKSKNQNGEANP